MTTEDDFQKALDDDPDDYHTRLVFADWLEERSDPRAEGYRCLGTRRLRPHVCKLGACFHDGTGLCGGGTGSRGSEIMKVSETLPTDWLVAIRPYLRVMGHKLSHPVNAERRTVEDDAALAFAKLTPHRRRELLANEEATVP